MKIKLWSICSAILIFAICAIIYCNNDGWILYSIQKKSMDSIKLIECYSTVRFTNQTTLKKIEFVKDSPDVNDEALKATLLIPTNEIDTVFIPRTRNYKIHHGMRDYMGDIDFICEEFYTVIKWNSFTQRNVIFTVMKPQEDYTKVYVSIDKLGWL